MSKTLADHARAYRTRKAERIARMERALEEISIICENALNGIVDRTMAIKAIKDRTNT